ncbi:MAG: 3-dehydroquinate synthase [Verrucomicrobiaceae bacterium]|nr:3-dehydroquinate synthase [Verrucomicrobiaceae bacterium]
MSQPAHHTVHVNLGSRSYDVLVGDGVLQNLGQQMVTRGLPQRVAVFTNKEVGAKHLKPVMKSLAAAGLKAVAFEMPATEKAGKSMKAAEKACRDMVKAGFDRKTTVVALGGGVIGDAAGFVAAIYQRGVPFVQLPTTVLSMVDSSVGGKTGVNLIPEAKNIIGAFHQPRLVIADSKTLRTLPKREWNSGFAEIIKHAAIRDAKMFEEIEKVAKRKGDLAALIARNVAIKASVVEADEHETSGLRALLNFGHTIGHGIEAAAGYGKLLHGEAISLGLVAAARLSVRNSGLEAAGAERIRDMLARFDLPVRLPKWLRTAEIVKHLMHDKKFDAGKIRFVLLRDLGDAFVSQQITLDQIKEEIEELRR